MFILRLLKLDGNKTVTTDWGNPGGPTAMQTKEMDNEKKSTDQITPMELTGTLAFVVRMPILQMPELVRLVQQQPGTHLIYQRTSVGRLKIVAED